jgi:tight adherence protein B
VSPVTRRRRFPGRLPAALGRVGEVALAAPRRVALVVAAVAGLGTATLAGPVAGMVAATYAGLAANGVLRRVLARRRTERRAHDLDSLCALAADLRAGLPPAAAWEPAKYKMVAVSGAARGGPGIRRPGAFLPGEQLTGRLAELAAAAWRLAEQTGAPLADLIERIEADARAMDRTRMAAGAQAAGAQATAWLLAALPLGGVALGYAIGVDPVHVLLRTPIGAACATGALLLQVAGLAWAGRLTDQPGRAA